MIGEVTSYPKWNEVLTALDLPILPGVPRAELNLEATIANSRRGKAGEDEPHRKFKLYVAANPHLLGLSKDAQPHVEFPLTSADRIDILFVDKGEMVAVEVKGPDSDRIDLNRGLFQCVKYKALLEAEQQLMQIGVNARSILVLTKSLPQDLVLRRQLLGIDVKVVRQI